MHTRAVINWNNYTKRLVQNTITNVHYVNAFPGSGKTYRFIHDIAMPHIKQRNNSILVYAAPSTLLLDQVKADLQRELRRAVAHNPDMERRAKEGEKFIHTIYSRDQEGRVAKLFEHLISTNEGKMSARFGSIILCTHECIAKVHYQLGAKQKVVLVYDEARACLEESKTLTLPKAVYDYLMEPRIENHRRGPLVEAVAAYEGSPSIWRWSDQRNPLPSITAIEELLPKTARRRTQLDSIMTMLENMQSAAIDVYVKVKQIVKQATRDVSYVIHYVLNPARMFDGYHRVLIMSANFDTSQMYHFLKASDPTRKVPIPLHNVTRQFIDKERMMQMVKRLQKTRITYVFKGPSLSKTQLKDSLAVAGKSEASIETFLDEWEDTVTTKESLRTLYDKYRREKEFEQIATRRDRTFEWQLLASLENEKDLQYVRTIAEHLTKASVQLYQDFLHRFSLRLGTLPVALNKTYSHLDSTSIWDQERLDNLTRFFERPRNGRIVEQMPMRSHGLNTFQCAHGAAFLATLKYNPVDHAFLKDLIPDYDATMDRTIDTAIQGLWRCSVRNADMDTPVLLIVTDSSIAEALREKFLSTIPKKFQAKCLRIIAPEKVARKWIPYRIVTTNNPRTAEHKEKYWNSLKGKHTKILQAEWKRQTGYGRITLQISRAKKAGNEELVQELIEQRSQLVTYEVWVRSVIGRRFANKSKKAIITKYESASVVLPYLQNHTFWAYMKQQGHSERIKILLAAYNLKIEPQQIEPYYPTDDFKQNWPKRAKESNFTNEAGYIIHFAKKAGIYQAKPKRVNNA